MVTCNQLYWFYEIVIVKKSIEAILSKEIENWKELKLKIN